MTIKKDLKIIRSTMLEELKLLRKGKITNQRARETSRLANTVISAIRATTKQTDDTRY